MMHDEAIWALAIAQAWQAVHLSNPNPRVGCVLVDSDGHVVAHGHTQAVGGPHAEVMALRDAATKGISTKGCTAYVTLEPCAHFGKTPPCCDALVAAQVSRVKVALLDPNPLVAGQGVARLRAAGIGVDVLAVTHPTAKATAELNIGFLSRMIRQRPWVRVKVATSLDGATALLNGASQWITGAQARADGHRWRARACAILTGVGTVLHDNPRLDVREVAVPRQPHVVLLDSRLQTPTDARLFQASRSCFVGTRVENSPKLSVLKDKGVAVWPLPAAANGHGVCLTALMAHLQQLQVNELHVEAGSVLNGALLEGGWIDEWLVYLAPKLMGPGRGIAQWGPLFSMSQARELTFNDIEMVGTDVRLLARPTGQADFWKNPASDRHSS